MTAIVDIGALEFQGLGPAEAARAAEAFERELAALLSRLGLPEGVHAEDLARDVADVALDPLPADAQTPEGLGTALARALYRRIAR